MNGVAIDILFGLFFVSVGLYAIKKGMGCAGLFSVGLAILVAWIIISGGDQEASKSVPFTTNQEIKEFRTNTNSIFGVEDFCNEHPNWPRCTLD